MNMTQILLYEEYIKRKITKKSQECWSFIVDASFSVGR